MRKAPLVYSATQTPRILLRVNCGNKVDKEEDGYLRTPPASILGKEQNAVLLPGQRKAAEGDTHGHVRTHKKKAVREVGSQSSKQSMGNQERTHNTRLKFLLRKKRNFPNKNSSLKRNTWQQLQYDMPLRKRALLKNRKWALALLDSAADATIVCRELQENVEAKATDDVLQVETADMHVFTPDRVYKVPIQLEGDIERIISTIF
ncbi:uncharacterized protein [Pleurodeles waltl]|uniref:uncharacterized protein n=1 Tax=Pleurodeles waltl TaxID=8319 RepID=UPI00370972DB